MRLRIFAMAVFCLPLVAFVACQGYEFVFQPDSQRLGTHLTFQVQTPSKADILFVIDNSGSMLTKQVALANSVDSLLQSLAPQDAKYRIGIVSTDAHGFTVDCNNVGNPPVASNSYSAMGAKGSYCAHNSANGNGADCTDPNCWQLRRPHDGVLGRLVAGYDPNSFNPNSYITCDATLPSSTACGDANCINPNNVDPHCAEGACLDPNCTVLAAVASLMPTGAFTGPASQYDSQSPGARAVINRDAINYEACNACNCPAGSCSKGETCYESCAKPTADVMVQAYFRANVNALGDTGFGWEEGLKSAMWAVGIDPENANDTVALDPSYNLTAANGADANNNPPNVYSGTDSPAARTTGSWLRDDALLAIMYVSDEQDCSMQESFINERAEFEDNANPNQPVGSICYQRVVQDSVLADGRYDPNRIAELLIKSKVSSSQVAIGVIGSVQLTGLQANNPGTDAVGADCVIGDTATPITACTCLDGTADRGWCQYTLDASGFTDACTPGCGVQGGACASGCEIGCDGQSGSRYVTFANNFLRRSFESVCRNDSASFGPAMGSFARIATQACFDLQGISPANGDPNNVTVQRTPKGSPPPPITLSYQPVTSAVAGWYYDAPNNKICLTGLDRLIDDKYDIFIQASNSVNYKQ